MKKILSVVLVLAMLVSSFSCVAFADDEIKILLDGTLLEMDQTPIIVDGRTLVPLRAIFEGLGALVTWDDSTKCATGIKDGKEIKITIDNKVAKVDGKDVTLDVGAQIVNSRTLVPVRFISESLGCEVDWDANTKTVIITSKSDAKTWTFDNLDKFISNKDFIAGGGYDAKNVSLSLDVDHTTGTGKSLKLDGRTATGNRIKLLNVFSPSDIGKTFTISAWIYIPEKSSQIKLSAYGDSGTEYAMIAYKFANTLVKANTWTEIKLVYKHNEPSVTQIGFEQYMTSNIPLFYIDDVTIKEGGNAPEEEQIEEKIEVNFVTDGHRPVPTEFSVGNSFNDLIYFATDKQTPEQLLATLPEGKLIVDNDIFINSLNSDSNKQYLESNYGKMEIVDVEGMPFKKAVRATVFSPVEPPYAYQISMGPLLSGKAEDGDVCLLKLYMRTEQGGQGEAQMGQVQIVVEQDGHPYDKILTANAMNAKQWKEFYFPFKFKNDFTRTNIRLGYYEQIVEIGGYEIINYGQNVNLEDLPTDTNSSPFLMPDAKWRSEAWERIENIRKGDFKVVVKDKNGNAVPNADVKFDMYEHQFEWGVAIDTPILSDKFYQKVLSENFNAGVSVGYTKWANYEKNPQYVKDMFKMAKDLGIKYLRGHTLLWDLVYVEGNSSLPADVPTLYNDKEALQKRIKEHINGITSDLKEYIPYEWDVLNEAVKNHVIQDIYGIEIVKEWYDMAREAMGEDGVLYYNDFRREKEFYDMMDKYIEMDVDFDGIGLQSHYGSAENPEVIYELYNKMASYGKRLKITEFDFMTPDNELQANFLRDFMIITFSHDAVDGLIMWGFRGGANNKYALYTSDNKPKEGLQIWQDLIYNKWWTKESGKTNENGEFNVRGYYGDYDVTITVGDTVKKVSAPFYKSKDNTLVIELN
ncbi:MAG: hypothetical protein E7391_08720 [Ruminococcaceae bacterium]|nr:hypothetical protein [Oscillospiraceae bacterium]